MSKKSLIKGTLVLTIASLITRLLGFGFRIYQSNVMGAEGMGLYQLLFPIYMLLWAASSAGIALAIAKMVAGEIAKGEQGNAIHILKTSLLISLPISVLLSILLYVFAPFIATYYIHEPITTMSLKILATCIPFMSTACCIRGYFQGRQEMSITALAQIVEQCGRMLAIYICSSFFVSKGIEFICALGVIGMCAGEFCSLILSYSAFCLKKRKIKLTPVTLHTSPTLNTLLALSIPITANRFLTSALQSLENILIPIGLQNFGLSSSGALSLYGEFSGMALPLLLFPSTVTSALATALVPAISESIAMNNKYRLQRTLSISIQFSSLIGIGATTLFLSFSKEIGLACYNLEEVGKLLKFLAIICPFLYLQTILTGAMNGLGLQKKTFQTNIVGSLVCILTIQLLVPQKGIIGFVIAMLLQSGVISCLLLCQVLKNVSLPINLMGWIIQPTLAGIISSFFTLFIYHKYIAPVCTLVTGTILGILLLASFYTALLFALKCITIKELKSFIASS